MRLAGSNQSDWVSFSAGGTGRHVRHCIAMHRIEAPSTERAILLYLVCVSAIVAAFAFGFWSAMQPRVIPNAGLANYQPPKAAGVPLHRMDSANDQIEKTAVAAAREQNEEQGIAPLMAFAAAERPIALAVAPRAPATVEPGARKTRAAVAPPAKRTQRAATKRVPRTAPEPARGSELAFHPFGSMRLFWGRGF
jgi:hypothetical protein